MKYSQEFGFFESDHLFKLQLMYQEKIHVDLIDAIEKEYFVAMAREQIYQAGSLRKQNKDGVEKVPNMKNVLAKI